MALLRMLNRQVYSTYGPTADTGGLMVNGAAVIYAYPDVETLLTEGPKAQLSGLPLSKPASERPD
jgi:hypothetical protein